jgi:hypothetical protein
VRDRINGLDPGAETPLYTRLSNLEYNTDGLMRGVRLIINTLGIADERLG